VTNDVELGRSVEARLTKAAIGESVRAVSTLVQAAFALRGALADLEVTRDQPYGADPAQRYDIWRAPAVSRTARPLVLFLHGGGFQQLDRASHWSFAERFARAGAVVINADYRLAPQHAYPRAADDAARVCEHVLERAEALGADPRQLVVAGVSAGANLALGLAITRAASTHAPRACVLFSGLLQVSDMARLYRSRSVARPLRARMASIGCDYLPQAAAYTPARPDPRLDPLLYLEQRAELPPEFAATFISTGSRDQLLEDALRLRNCLVERGAEPALDVVSGAGHAFQGFILRAGVRAVWQRCFAFLERAGLQLASARSSGAAS